MKIGIYGYGNLGKGVEAAICASSDAELVGVFSRRDPEKVKTVSGCPVFSADSVSEYVGKIDVLIICGGSATDLPEMTPNLAKLFNVVDSFDTHAKIPSHFDAVDEAAQKNKTTALISAGWDPGLFSIARVLADSVLLDGDSYTFWGRGVSQGHSDAIRRLEGVQDARQYTVPVSSALEAVRAGERPELSTREKHTRECYVVPKPGADLAAIERSIKTMPNYFADYDTTVYFVSQEELVANHTGLPHGGCVIRSGNTAGDQKNVIEFSLKLDSNPAFTGSVLVACARAVYRMAKRGSYGCKTVLDIAPADLSPYSPEELRRRML